MAICSGSADEQQRYCDGNFLSSSLFLRVFWILRAMSSGASLKLDWYFLLKNYKQFTHLDRQTLLAYSEESSWLVEPVLKTTRLLILGAGHVAREVAYYAKTA